MKSSILLALLFIALFEPCVAHGEKATKIKKKKSATSQTIQAKAISDTPPKMDSKWYLLSALGAGYWRGFSFFSSLGVLYLRDRKSNFGFGSENQLLLVSKGALFSPHLALWYRPLANEFWSNGIQLGALLGPSFSSTPSAQGVSVSAQLEILFSKKIDEMVFMRTFLRTGWIHNAFLAQTGLSFVFDFK